MKKIIEAAEKRCQPMFARIDEIALCSDGIPAAKAGRIE